MLENQKDHNITGSDQVTKIAEYQKNKALDRLIFLTKSSREPETKIYRRPEHHKTRSLRSKKKTKKKEED